MCRKVTWMADEPVGVFKRERRRQGDSPGPRKTRGGAGRPRARTRMPSPSHSRSRILRTAILAAFGATGLLAGLARLFGAYSPFGIVAVAAVAACCDCDAAGVMPTVLGALVGGALSGGPTQVVTLAVSSVLFLVLPERFRRWT
ncbi:MAG TPA: hypothetical protein PLG65_06965, partial [Bacillota bacterium]|nr:hypothetical protein [Bacillota bacterium]